MAVWVGQHVHSDSVCETVEVWHAQFESNLVARDRQSQGQAVILDARLRVSLGETQRKQQQNSPKNAHPKSFVSLRVFPLDIR